VQPALLVLLVLRDLPVLQARLDLRDLLAKLVLRDLLAILVLRAQQVKLEPPDRKDLLV